MSGDTGKSLALLSIRYPDSAPVSELPEVSLEDWAIYEVRGQLHLIGVNPDQDRPRYSTSLIAFDRTSRTAITVSGRKYLLIGEPGPDPRALLAWQISCQIRNQRTRDVTQQLLNPQ